MEKALVLEAVKAAYAVTAPAKTGAFGGCGRVYVSLTSGNDRALVNAVAAAAKKLGLIFQRKAHYGMRNALYVGYDNADGRALARGEAICDRAYCSGDPGLHGSLRRLNLFLLTSLRNVLD